MSKKPKNLSSDLRGFSKLTIDAIKGTNKIVESLHSTINQYTSILGESKQQTSGITALVYKSINGVTQLLGEGIDAILNKSSQLQAEYSGDYKLSATREAVASAMNGVLGDHFKTSDNPLAITMSFRINGKSLENKHLIELLKNSINNITLFVHGLCMNDLQWHRENHNHADLIAKELGHTVIHLHYNTGLHVSENGQQLSVLLNKINSITKLPLNIVAHSMGGLLVRSACYYAKKYNHNWLPSLNKIIFLGTPHHGAILAKGGALGRCFITNQPL